MNGQGRLLRVGKNDVLPGITVRLGRARSIWNGGPIFVPIWSPTFGTERDRKGLKRTDRD
jgi:hypothetical protein